MSSAVPCRNGVGCTRPDCWYAHPDGRVPVGAASVPRSFVPGGPSRGGPPPAGGNVCRFGRQCHRDGCYYAHPEGREIDEAGPSGGLSAGPGAGGRKAGQPTSPSNRSDFNPDDWEEEEELKEEDFIAQQGGVHDCECCGGKPYECQAPACKANGKCGCTLGETADDDEEDESLKDEWFPEFRNCPCCAGTIYRCQKQQADCISGNCFCSLQKNKPAQSTQ